MSRIIDKELLDYYRQYCELTIWFKKIVLHSEHSHVITIKDITKEFIAERNRILLHIPKERRKILRTNLNTIALSYYNKVSNWTKHQKTTTDMV